MDEVVAYQQTVNGVSTRYYPHYNHLYSVAALTDAAGAVVERFTYDAYGKQTITAPVGGVVRVKSVVGWDRGFTGYIADIETGLLHARFRQYSSKLGGVIGRDPMEYIDGRSMYSGYFVPNRLDSLGLECEDQCRPVGCTVAFEMDPATIRVELQNSTVVGSGGIQGVEDVSAEAQANAEIADAMSIPAPGLGESVANAAGNATDAVSNLTGPKNGNEVALKQYSISAIKASRIANYGYQVSFRYRIKKCESVPCTESVCKFDGTKYNIGQWSDWMDASDANNGLGYRVNEVGEAMRKMVAEKRGTPCE